MTHGSRHKRREPRLGLACATLSVPCSSGQTRKSLHHNMRSLLSSRGQPPCAPSWQRTRAPQLCAPPCTQSHTCTRVRTRRALLPSWRLSVLPAFSPPRSDASALSEDAEAPLPCVSAWSCSHRPLSHGAVLVTSSPFLISDFSSPDFRGSGPTFLGWVKPYSGSLST